MTKHAFCYIINTYNLNMADFEQTNDNLNNLPGGRSDILPQNHSLMEQLSKLKQKPTPTPNQTNENTPTPAQSIENISLDKNNINPPLPPAPKPAPAPVSASNPIPQINNITPNINPAPAQINAPVIEKPVQQEIPARKNIEKPQTKIETPQIQQKPSAPTPQAVVVPTTPQTPPPVKEKVIPFNPKKILKKGKVGVNNVFELQDMLNKKRAS